MGRSPDPGVQEALAVLARIRREVSLETGPVPLGEAYLRLVEAVEAAPENRDGADKTWVERATEGYRAHYSKAREAR